MKSVVSSLDSDIISFWFVPTCLAWDPSRLPVGIRPVGGLHAGHIGFQILGVDGHQSSKGASVFLLQKRWYGLGCTSLPNTVQL